MLMMYIYTVRIKLHGTLLPFGLTNTTWPLMVPLIGESRKSSLSTPPITHLILWLLLHTLVPWKPWVSSFPSLPPTSQLFGKTSSPNSLLLPNLLLLTLSPTMVESWWLNLWFSVTEH